MSHGPVRVQDRGAARRLTLVRPPLNVLDTPTIRLLDEALASAPDTAKVVVFDSAIDGAFSAGSDVGDHRRDEAPGMLEAFHALIRRLWRSKQASICAVDGRCLGGGCELALSCDIVLATARSTFGQPEIDVGCFPPVASVLLPRRSPRAAMAMVLGGEPVTAAEAARAGLITALVDDLDAAVAGWVERLAAKSGAVLALARQALREGATGPREEALERVERLYRSELLATEDAEEGVRAFLEKRKPRWRDR